MPTESVVHLIDDDDAVRDSLRFMLSVAGHKVLTYPAATAFLEALPRAPAGCVVTDIRMPGINGLELQRRLKQNGIDFPVIVMTGHGDVPLAVEAMKAGAIDFIEKPFSDEVLLGAIRQAAAFQSRADQRKRERQAINDRIATLSPREREVLAGLVAGQANKVIGVDLGISSRTVEVHRAMVMAKMGAKSLSELVRMWVTAGLT